MMNTMYFLLIITLTNVYCNPFMNNNQPKSLQKRGTIRISDVKGDLTLTGDDFAKLMEINKKTGRENYIGNDIYNVLNNEEPESIKIDSDVYDRGESELKKENYEDLRVLPLNNENKKTVSETFSVTHYQNIKNLHNSSYKGKIQNILFIFCIVISIFK